MDQNWTENITYMYNNAHNEIRILQDKYNIIILLKYINYILQDKKNF